MTPDERDDRNNFSTTVSAKGPLGGTGSDSSTGTDYGVAAGDKYDDDVRKFVAAGRVEPAAQEAKRSLDGPDGRSLHDAEVATARHGALPGDPAWVTKMREAAHAAIDRMLTGLVHAQEWVKAQSAKQPTDRGDHPTRH